MLYWQNNDGSWLHPPTSTTKLTHPIRLAPSAQIFKDLLRTGGLPPGPVGSGNKIMPVGVVEEKRKSIFGKISEQASGLLSSVVGGGGKPQEKVVNF